MSEVITRVSVIADTRLLCLTSWYGDLIHSKECSDAGATQPYGIPVVGIAWSRRKQQRLVRNILTLLNRVLFVLLLMLIVLRLLVLLLAIGFWLGRG